MGRGPAILVGAVMIVNAAPAAAGQMSLRWYGQSFFLLESSKGTRVAIDPHGIDAFGRVSVKADLVLITHLHTDHTQIDAIEDRDKARILVGLRVQGKRTQWNPVNEQFRDVRVRSVGVYHDASQGLERGKNTIFVIEMDGVRIVHLGDLGHVLTPAQVREVGPVDVLLVPAGGAYTINGAEARQVVAQLRPRQYVVPMHYGNESYDELMPLDEFLEEQKPGSVRRTPETNLLRIDPAVRPAEPVVVVLGWK